MKTRSHTTKALRRSTKAWRRSTKAWRLALSLSFVVLSGGCGGVGEVGDSYEGPDLIQDEERQTFFRRPYPNGTYIVTTFGGPSDSSAYGGKTACGARVYGKKYYSTGVHGWGCNAKIKIEGNGKCVVAKVIDNGPAGWVETKAGNKCGLSRILDVSPAVTKHLYNKSGYGWSDCKKLTVTKVAKSTPTGPCGGGGGSYTPDNAPGVRTACQVNDGRKGVCKHTSKGCANTFEPDHCPGDTFVQCCPETAAVTAPPTNNGDGSCPPHTTCQPPADPPPATTEKGVGDSCQVGPYTGKCQHTGNSSCTSGFRQYKCLGKDYVQCCLDGNTSEEDGVGESCAVGSQSGTCNDVLLTPCATGYKNGYCPGGNNVKCCLQ